MLVRFDCKNDPPTAASLFSLSALVPRLRIGEAAVALAQRTRVHVELMQGEAQSGVVPKVKRIVCTIGRSQTATEARWVSIVYLEQFQFDCLNDGGLTATEYLASLGTQSPSFDSQPPHVRVPEEGDHET